jgi:hypothetical protein
VHLPQDAVDAGEIALPRSGVWTVCQKAPWRPTEWTVKIWENPSHEEELNARLLRRVVAVQRAHHDGIIADIAYSQKCLEIYVLNVDHGIVGKQHDGGGSLGDANGRLSSLHSPVISAWYDISDRNTAHLVIVSAQINDTTLRTKKVCSHE